MGRFKVVVVTGTIQVGRHRRQELRSVLPVVGRAHFDARDFGNSVRAIGRLKRPGQQVALFHRLRTCAWIDAGGAEKQQTLRTSSPRLVNHVGLDCQILVNELRRKSVIGDDPTHFCRGQKHILRLLSLKEILCRSCVDQVQFGMGSRDQIAIAVRFETSH